MNDRTVSGEELNAISEDVFLLNGFMELVKAYQDKKQNLQRKLEIRPNTL